MDLHDRSLLGDGLIDADGNLRNRFEDAEEGIWIVDRHDDTVAVNKSMLRMLGCTADEILGQERQPFFIALPQRHDLPPESLFHRAEIEVRHKSGSSFWTSALFFEIAEGSNRGGSIGVLVDITARKRAETSLRESERQYYSLFDNAPIGIYRTSEDGLLTMINRKLVRMLGFESAEELVGQDLDRLCRPQPSRTLYRMRLKKAGKLAGVESVWKTRSGAVLHVRENARLIQSDSGKTVFFEGTVEDVTEQKVVEQSLRRSEAKFRSLVDNAPYGIYKQAVGADKFISANPALVRMLGYFEESELIALDGVGSIYVDPLQRDLLLEQFRATEKVETEVTWKRKDGAPIKLRIRARRAQDATEVTMEGFVEDLSERWALEQRMQQAQKMEGIGRLAGGVAHDLNNVLQSIMLPAQLLLASETQPQAREKLEGIVDVAQRGASVVRQLLAFSRRDVVQPRIIALNMALQEMQKLLRPLVREDIELKYEMDADAGSVLIDPGQLVQVVMNLVVNAVDAMPSGGTITISSRAKHVSEDKEGGRRGLFVELAVCDTGTGIPESHHELVFEPFFTTKEVGKGTGLGLSTVYGIIRQCGGLIELTSQPNHGSIFRVLLPRQDSRVDSAIPTSGSECLGTGRILLVEDESQVRAAVEGLLTTYGYKVISVPSAGAAERVPIFDFDLLVTDVVMPGANGPTLAKNLRAHKPNLRVLFMSGYPEGAIPTELLESKSAYIQKPFSCSDLLRAIRKLSTDLYPDFPLT